MEFANNAESCPRNIPRFCTSVRGVAVHGSLQCLATCSRRSGVVREGKLFTFWLFLASRRYWYILFCSFEMHISSHRKGNVRISNEGLLGMFSTSKMDDFRGFRLVSYISRIVSEFFFLQQKPNEIWASWMYTTKEVITFSETFLKREGRKLRISEDFWFRCLDTTFRVPTTESGPTMGPGTTWIHWVRSHEDNNIQIL